ncbi:MAG TPA: hypothetical protein VIJ94_18760 [Caulobacteraceae bacterium]
MSQGAPASAFRSVLSFQEGDGAAPLEIDAGPWAVEAFLEEAWVQRSPPRSAAKRGRGTTRSVVEGAVKPPKITPRERLASARASH